VITALKLVEISLVDSPCNPDAVINMWKADMDYVPSGDEVVAKARELAEDAGSRRYKDFLFKARERLIAAALASDQGDDDDDDRDDDRDPDAGAAPAGGDDDAPATDPDGGKPDDQDKQPPTKPAAGEQPPARPKPGEQPAAKPQPKPKSPDPQADGDEDDADASRDGDGDADDDAPPPKPKLASNSKDQVKRVATSGDADTDDAGAAQADADRIQTAHDHLVALGAQCSKENCGDAAPPPADVAGRPRPQATPTAPDPDEDTAKLARGDAMMADLAKRFGDTITTLNATIGDLTKRLEQVEAEPAAPRTAVGPLRAVSKVEDASPNSANGASAISADDLKKVIDTLPEQERGQFLLRIALSNPTLVHAARAAA